MREIVLDTETTGLEPLGGDRIVEIGCLELFNHIPTGRTFHEYLDPERLMGPEASRITGITDDMLRGKPKFAQVADAFLEFVGDAPMVIHNASFDMGFLNAELRRCKKPILPDEQAIDTLLIARKRFPGSPASLDALCKRFGVDNSNRELHGALLDSELLAEVYLELVGGRQPELVAKQAGGNDDEADGAGLKHQAQKQRPTKLASLLTDEERAAHAAFVKDELGDDALWLSGGAEG